MTIEERLEKYLGKDPQIDPTAYVSRRATLVGDVKIGKNASVWPGCVLRADINSIELGENSNIQDGTMVHLADDAVIHACTIGDGCLIGMGSIILDKAVIGDNCIVGAGALVTKNTVVPAGSLVLGSPAKVVKTLDAETQKGLEYWAKKYTKLAAANKAKEEGEA